MRGERDLRLERAWRRRVGQQRSSELSIREFCAREGLAESAFYFWRRELARREAESRVMHHADAGDVSAGEPTRRRSSVNRRPGFVPVVVAEPREQPRMTGEHVSPGLMELVHPSGVVIRVPSRCDADALRVLLEVLDDRSRKAPPC